MGQATLARTVGDSAGKRKYFVLKEIADRFNLWSPTIENDHIVAVCKFYLHRLLFYCQAFLKDPL
jgi:hypothetical protein